MKIGDRVQVPVWTDTWMMGDRYGVVTKLTKERRKAHALRGAEIAHVHLDKSGRTKRFRSQDLELVESMDPRRLS